MSAAEKLRVLIAEDDFLVSRMIVRVIDGLGHEVVGSAADGEQAIEMTKSLRPDVLLMDIQMGEMDGTEACRRIQETCPVPVVILTHEAREKDFLAALAKIDAEPFVTEPCAFIRVEAEEE